MLNVAGVILRRYGTAKIGGVVAEGIVWKRRIVQRDLKRKPFLMQRDNVHRVARCRIC